MEVAFWELVPYLPIKVEDVTEDLKREFIRMNAGKAFEFMVEQVVIRAVSCICARLSGYADDFICWMPVQQGQG